MKKAAPKDDLSIRPYSPKYFRSPAKSTNPKDSSIWYFVPYDLLATSIKVARITRASYRSRVGPLW